MKYFLRNSQQRGERAFVLDPKCQYRTEQMNFRQLAYHPRVEMPINVRICAID